jgi:hypothetical protein
MGKPIPLPMSRTFRFGFRSTVSNNFKPKGADHNGRASIAEIRFSSFKSNVDSIRLIFHQKVLRLNSNCNLKLIIKFFNLCYFYVKD